MNTAQKSYLVIRNVCTNNNLRTYLEQICRDEKIHIIEEYIDSYSFLNQKPSLYAEHGAKPSFDVLLESYSPEKLRYIEYLYNIYEKQYRYSGNIVSEILEDKIDKSDFVIGDIKVASTTEEVLTMEQYNRKNMIDSIAYMRGDDIYKNSSGWAHIDYGIRTPTIQKQSKLHIFKQKVKEFWNNTGFGILSAIITTIEKTLAFFGLVMLLTIILNVVK